MTLAAAERRQPLLWLFRLTLMAAVLGAAVWLFWSGAYRLVHAERVRDALRMLGPWGPAAFVLAFALVQPLGVPSHLLVFGAAMVWPGPLAFGASLLGAMLAQLLVFFLCRRWLQAWAQARVPPWFRRFDLALLRHPMRTIFLVRLVLFTSPLFTSALALSQVRVLPMFVGTALGVSPVIAIDVWIGEGLWSWLGVSRTAGGSQ